MNLSLNLPTKDVQEKSTLQQKLQHQQRKKFLSSIKEEFGKKILNRNTIKLSCPCMNNMQNIISEHKELFYVEKQITPMIATVKQKKIAHWMVNVVQAQ